MRTLVLASFLLLLPVGVFSQELPDVPDNASLRDDNIRRRSIELDRISKEMKKGASSKGAVRDDINLRFKQIKKDYEGMQKNQIALMNAYGAKQRDVKIIRDLIKDISKQSKRLHQNLFIDKPEKFKKPDKKAPMASEEEMKVMLFTLDKSVAGFSQSKMFRNIQVVAPADALEAHRLLVAIMNTSRRMHAELSKKK